MQKHSVSPRCARWLVLHALAVSTSFAQGRPLEPPSQAPSEGRAVELLSPPNFPVNAGAPSTDELLRQVGVSRAELVRRQRARTTTPLRPATQEPPEVAALRALPQPPPRPDSASADSDAGSGPRHPGPFPTPAAEAFMTLASASSQAEPRMSATRTAEHATLSGFGTMLARGYFPFNVNNFTTLWGVFVRASNPGAATQAGGPYDVKPYMYVRFDVTTTGWYLINVRATASTAEMRRYSSAGTFDLVQAFGTPTTATGGYYSYPVLVELAAGVHHFYWTNISQSVWVAEVVAIKF